MGWVRSDAKRRTRRGAIGEVLGAVRPPALGLLPAPLLAETVATDPLIEPSFERRKPSVGQGA